MGLDNVHLDKYLTSVFSGAKINYVTHDNKEYQVIFFHPNNMIKLRADCIRDRSYNMALEAGLMTTNDLIELMRKRGILTEEDDLKIKKLEEQLKAQEVLLAKTTKVKANQDRILGIIHKLRLELNQLKSKQTMGSLMSAESKAEEDKTMYLCWACSFVDDDPPVHFWDTLDDFYNETDMGLRDKILIAFIDFNRGIDTDVIRGIARSSLWRIRYINSQKTSDPLFGVPTSEYTNDMLNLAYWSNYYQNIYDMMPEDRPPDSIIDDDEALDAFMTSFYEDRSKEDAARRSKVKTKGRLSAFDREEVIVTQSNELYHDIQYDKPREAQRIKDKIDLRKKTKRG